MMHMSDKIVHKSISFHVVHLIDGYTFIFYYDNNYFTAIWIYDITFKVTNHTGLVRKYNNYIMMSMHVCILWSVLYFYPNEHEIKKAKWNFQM